mgnify:CR=1 FL=1
MDQDSIQFWATKRMITTALLFKDQLKSPNTNTVLKDMQHPNDTNDHLNGKVGDIRSLDKKSRCFTVHFEDKSLEPCSVNCKKVRVLSNKALES